jgi:uncharacterized protein (DUF1330 family)
MNKEKAILIITAKVKKTNMEELPSYKNKIGPVLGKYGAQPVASYKAFQDVVGTDSPELVSILEFPNSQAINDAINSEEFKALAELRARVFSKLNLVIGKAS